MTRIDNYGKKIWDVYNSAGFSYEDRRLLVSVATPLQADPAAGKGVFFLYSGETLSVTLSGAVIAECRVFAGGVRHAELPLHAARRGPVKAIS